MVPSSCDGFGGVPSFHDGEIARMNGVYPLGPEQDAAIATLANATIDLDRHDYCIEGIAREKSRLD